MRFCIFACNMVKKKKKTRRRGGLQVVTLCISTAMVLILLGMVVFSVLTARNLSNYVKENLTVTLMLAEDMTNPEAQKLCADLKKKHYVYGLTYISKEDVLKEQTKELGADPSEFVGTNPFVGSVELQLKADYANNDSLVWIAKELKKNAQVTEITYPQMLIDSVNKNLRKINIVLLILAVLLAFVSFSLINNSIKLSVYARRFTIRTMKLVGASWGFIRRPFLKRSVVIGLVASLIACAVLAGGIYMLWYYEHEVLTVITWQVMLITAASVFIFGLLITLLCSYVSVNKFLRMTAGELYKI